MPIYEYQCSKCGEFEVMQKITDKALTKCPTCKAKVTKLMSNTSFQLKGSGWYITDYARSGSGGGKGKEAKSGEAGASESKSETKAEAKSETKSESKSESKPKASSEGKGKQAAAA
jgi:putative FmdB family regulatory protein